MKTIDIKGKKYVPVSERIKEFRKLYPEGKIITNIIRLEHGMCVIKTEVYKNKDSVIVPDATGYAFEMQDSSNLNKVSFIENCETSSIGRAIGILGIGIDGSVASADEMLFAIAGQDKIDNTKIQALQRAITNNKLAEDTVKNVLANFGYEEIKDIQKIDYMKVVEALKEAKNE